MAGRTGAADESGRYGGVVYLPCTAENGFQPPLPDRPVDLVYLCFPNNPTGAVADQGRAGALGRLGAARTAPSSSSTRPTRPTSASSDIPHSIYEVEGAREVAIEFRSFSKSAGFTGTRCAFTVVPKDATGRTVSGERVPLNGLWFRRQSTKFNGVPYVIQKAAAAVYTDEGQRRCGRWSTSTWRTRASSATGWRAAGLTVYGGRNAPYIWIKMAPRPVLLGFLRQAPRTRLTSSARPARDSAPPARATSA